MIRAIIFDCFGVLAEDGWLPFKRQYINNDNNLEIEVADLGKQNEYGYITNDEYYERLSILTGADQSAIRQALLKRVPNLELLEYIKRYLSPKYKIGLLSNANHDVVSELFTLDQSELFDSVVLSYEVGMVKPETRMYELIADRLEVSPDECILIDDIERYCTAAEDVGMKTVLYQDVKQLRSAIGQFL